MDLDPLLRGRRSVRAFRRDPIPEDTLRDLVDLANWAPSAGNLQARDFILVREDRKRRALAKAADQGFIEDAPAVLVVCTNAARVAKYGKRGRDLYAIQDAAAATENLLLAAHARGIATVWVRAFDEDSVRRALNLPSHVRPVAIVPLGWPAEEPAASDRLPLGEILHFDGW